MLISAGNHWSTVCIKLAMLLLYNFHPTFNHDKPTFCSTLSLLPSIFSQSNTNYWSSIDILTPKGLALITAFERPFLMSAGILAGFRENFSAWNQSVQNHCMALEIYVIDAWRSQMPHLYHTNTQAQTYTCDFDGIRPSLADLRKSLRD